MPHLKVLGPITLAFLIGSAGAFVFYALSFPAPWLVGSVVAVSAAVLSGAPVSMPSAIRQFTFLILGVSIGSGVDPDILANIPKWPLSLFALVVSTILIIHACMAFLTRQARWTRSTAFFASVPGALSYVLIMSLRSPADTPLVVMTQLLRVVSLLLILPLIATNASLDAIIPDMKIAGYWDTILMIVAGAAIGYGLERVQFPAGMLFGGMIVSTGLHVTGIVQGQIPPVILIPCQILLGCMMGLRFGGTKLSLLAKALGPSAGAFLIAFGISAALAAGVAMLLDLPFNQLLIAFAPGALEVMIILSFVLGLDPAFVAAHHLVRFIGIAIFLPVLTKLFLRNPSQGNAG